MMTRLLLVILLVMPLYASHAQSKKKPPYKTAKAKNAQNKFLEKQFWLGFKAGVNLTDPVVLNRYTVLTPTNYSIGLAEKEYRSFDQMGSHASLEVTFYYKGFSISTQPTYSQSRFSYVNDYRWSNPESAGSGLTLNYEQEQRLDYADFPLIAKYEFTSNTLRPFIQAGVFYSIIVNANKSVKVSGIDQASGGVNSFTNEPVIVGAKDLFENYWGVIAGGGLNYNLGNVRVVLDVSYKMGMSNMANVKSRFSNDRLTGIGDVQDDLKTNQLVFSLGCLFPLRFLTSDFKSLD